MPVQVRHFETIPPLFWFLSGKWQKPTCTSLSYHDWRIDYKDLGLFYRIRPGLMEGLGPDMGDSGAWGLLSFCFSSLLQCMCLFPSFCRPACSASLATCWVIINLECAEIFHSWEMDGIGLVWVRYWLLFQSAVTKRERHIVWAWPFLKNVLFSWKKESWQERGNRWT